MSHADSDIVVMAAAVADFTPTTVATDKLKKEATASSLDLPLKRTVDILRELGHNKRDGQLLVGFALETNDGESNAQQKLTAKNLDLIVLNNPTEDGAGFGTKTNRVTLYFRDGRTEDLPILDKPLVARRILDAINEGVPAA
jgi:phosphopantothenoylcysteine decarboxylase/phosphopantothenate--cysteine ligase